MTNPIIKAIHEIFPGYDLPPSKAREADRADDPEAVAVSVPVQAQALRQMQAEIIGIDPDQLTADDIVPRMMLSHATTGYSQSVNTARWLLQFMSTERVLELGRASADAFTSIYREVLGREPDASGLAYWRGVYSDGLPLSEVIRHIENSPEAQHASPSG